MPSYEKVNGNWREIWSAHVKVNGEWRDIDISGKVNGEWKLSHKHFIDESDITGFRMVYHLNPNRRHPLFPNLAVNKNLPVTFDLTGDNIGMNESTKGVLYHYERFGDEVGTLMYEGNLYAVLGNGCLVDVGLSKNTKVNNDDQRLPGPISEIPEVWATNKMRELKIDLTGYTLFEAFKYHLYGWNSLFDTNQFVLPDHYTEDAPYRDINRLQPRIMIPVENQLSSFDSVASIGIARNLNTVDTMLGAYGTLDHTIESIKVNGVSKPFIVEIYK